MAVVYATLIIKGKKTLRMSRRCHEQVRYSLPPLDVEAQ